jgi:HAD superfamily hydrolase (TIGR01509 family)
MTSTLRAVILDLDGTLIDSNDAHARAWVTAFQTQHLDIPFEKIRPLIGMGGDKLIPELSDVDPEGEEGKALTKAWAEAFTTMIPELKATPGAAELVAGLQALGLKVMLGSSGEDEVVEAELKHLGLESLLNSRVSSEEVENSKPSPDIVAVALKKLGVQPAEALMVGDTHFDAEASQKAGVRVALLRSGGNTDLSAESGDVLIYADPQALLEAFNGEDERLGR